MNNIQTHKRSQFQLFQLNEKLNHETTQSNPIFFETAHVAKNNLQTTPEVMLNPVVATCASAIIKKSES